MQVIRGYVFTSSAHVHWHFFINAKQTQAPSEWMDRVCSQHLSNPAAHFFNGFKQNWAYVTLCTVFLTVCLEYICCWKVNVSWRLLSLRSRNKHSWDVLSRMNDVSLPSNIKACWPKSFIFVPLQQSTFHLAMSFCLTVMCYYVGF